MTDIPDPDDEIPEFLLDNFETESPRTLRAIAECADDRTNTRGVPKYVKDAFALQDKATIAATAEYARELAAFLEDEDYDALEAVPEEVYLDPSEVSRDRGIGELGPERRAFKEGGASSGSDDDEDGSGGFLGLF